MLCGCVAADAELVDQLLLALRHLGPKSSRIELRFPDLRKQFVFFFLDVVLDQLA
ncbi:MAG TPA: hypothetical protein VES91_02400 [Burkholderiaceae bacterium]|nr:hypothetical protein [Burkholderiaceae bacterium]